MSHPRPISLLAERAVRFLRKAEGGIDSRTLAHELLKLRTGDEAAAFRLLESSIGGDSRLAYENGRWKTTDEVPDAREPVAEETLEPDRTLVYVMGHRSDPTLPYQLQTVAALRLSGEEVTGACGGDAVEGPYGNRLRGAMLELLDGAVPVVHASKAALKSLEQWLGEPLSCPVWLRRLGSERVGLPLHHSLEELVARLGLEYREGEDPLEMADTLDSCLTALRSCDASRTSPGPIAFTRATASCSTSVSRRTSTNASAPTFARNTAAPNECSG